MNDFLIEKLKESKYSRIEIEQILDGLSVDKYTTFRINRLKCDKNEIMSVLESLDIEYEEDENFEDALILKNYKITRGVNIDKTTGLCVDSLEMYKNGKIYVQSLSSMAPVYILEPKENENILDMCAAPGSKATMIQSITKNKANLTAVELHKDRFEKLKYNCKLQNANVLCINQNSLDLNDAFKFDKIILDAPCSGSGTININTNSYERNFTKELIKKCVETQKKLIKKAAKLLPSGKELIYSTCSLLSEENEDIISFATKNGFEIENLSGSFGSTTSFIKIMPDSLHEGFFIAKLIREG